MRPPEPLSPATKMVLAVAIGIFIALVFAEGQGTPDPERKADVYEEAR